MSNIKAGIFIDKIEFSNGLKLELKDNSIIVFVGPNNSGKSITLKEINSVIRGNLSKGLSVNSLSIQKIGDQEDLKKTLLPFFSKKHREYHFSSMQYENVNESKVFGYWNGKSSNIGELANFFVAHLTTEKRLADCAPIENFDAINRSRGPHPIHAIYQNSDLEARVSNLFFQAFSKDLVVHRNAGKTIPLYVGVRPVLNDGENPVSRSYLDRIEQLDPLVDQGDGLKSFASLLLRVWTGDHTILLLDEPEAFLHPPQARAVGELISSGVDYEKQIFVATHSNEIIQGMLSKFPGRISVVRLQREAIGATATYLPSEKIEQLWRDPILRYSNVLNGLFHSNVVVTEADGDCRFYEAIAECGPQTLKTTFYTYAGGKDRIPIIVRALRALQVPVKTVVDFDIIANDVSIKNLIESHGGQWIDFKSDIQQIRAVVQSKKEWLIGSSFKYRVAELLETIQDNVLVEKNTLDRLKNLMREASPWDAIKAAGVAAVPSGEATKRLQNLLLRLRDINIFVVPVGEMEGFCKSVGSHGPRWVDEVLTREICSDPELENARIFVSELSANSDLELKGRGTPYASVKRMDGIKLFTLSTKLRVIREAIIGIAKLIFWVTGAFIGLSLTVSFIINLIRKS